MVHQNLSTDLSVKPITDDDTIYYVILLLLMTHSFQSSILNKCTVDDGVAPNQESLHKLSCILLRCNL